MSKKTRNRTVRHPVEGLEQMLQYWENLKLHERNNQLIDQVWHRGTVSKSGPKVHWSEFRKELLAARPDSKFDTDRFAYDEEQGQRFLQKDMKMALALYLWAQNSRRVYHLSDELSLLLASTKFGSMKCGDYRLPFPAFCVTLEKPIDCCGHRYDCIVIGQDTVFGNPKTHSHLVGVVSRDIKDYNDPFGEICRKMARAVDSRNSVLVDSIANDYERLRHRLANRANEVLTFVVDLNAPPEMSLQAFSENLRERTARLYAGTPWENLGVPVTEQVIQILIGLPVYLSSLQGNDIHTVVSPFQRAPRIADPSKGSAITDEAQVCSVSSVHKFSPEELETIRTYLRSGNTTGVALSAHFRTAHWRRPPGKGSDPTALKTVWVRHSFVRSDRLEPNEAPEGSRNDLS